MVPRRRVAIRRTPLTVTRVKVVKQQINGDERVVLKRDATFDDLQQEAARLRTTLGYEVRPDGQVGRYVASHPFYRGKFILMLEPD